MRFLQSSFKNSVQHGFLTEFCKHLSPAHRAPDSCLAAFSAFPEVVCPQKGPLPVSGREREQRWSHRLRCAGVFLVAISCQLPLNGLQMVRKRLGAARGPVSRGRIYNRMSVYASPDWAWLPVGTEVEGEEWGKWGRGLWVEETGSRERMFPFM